MNSPKVRAYVVKIMDHGLSGNLSDRNADVFVYSGDGNKYVATFFTLENIKTIMARHKRSGESAAGIYFWAAEMIIVDRLDQLTIETAVADLLTTGEFYRAFEGPFPSED